MHRKKTLGVLTGVILILLGNFGFFIAAMLGVVHAIFYKNQFFFNFIHDLLWYSATPVVIGFALIALDIFFIVRNKRKNKCIKYLAINNPMITVVLTAYNDEESIGDAVRDFLSAPNVKRVLVISNNSVDNTMRNAEIAGALVFNETHQGYGACVYRALMEASRYDDCEAICLCEGDRTFRSYDIIKLIAYLPHADIVNGTRIVEQLQESSTQLSTFMHYGNFAVAKLLEFKYLGDVTLSDVGTTYKIIRRDILLKLLPKLSPNVNLEFNPYFLETAIYNSFSVIECPISFYPRVGKSKGGNQSNWIAMKLGLSMIFGILFGWNPRVNNVK